MSSVAHVENGQIVNNGNEVKEKTKANKEHESSLDKDAFLQLLVAQMKYQDPLQPTSNTEYISQLATFSSLEEMQNMGSSMEMSRATSLVGQYVFMNVTDSAGKTTYPEGVVDYVVYKNGTAFLSIKETLYDIKDLDTVADSEYLLATKVHEGFLDGLNQLPKVEHITANSKSALETIEGLVKIYDNMSEYQRSFLSEENKEKFFAYVERYKEVATKPEQPKPEDENKEETKEEESKTEETVL